MSDNSWYQNAIEKSFLIVNKSHKTVPFKLNDPQLQILQSLKGRDIILKARQEGISSLILALFAIDFISIENIRCVVISHEQGAAQRLFDKVKFYLESLKQTFPGELPYKLKYNSRSEMVNLNNGATFYIGYAGARAFGHGDTINNLHVSELSRYPNQEKIMIGLMQAVPRSGRIIIETTANGIGDYFYTLWKKSQNPASPFKPHFLPWFMLDEYQLPIYEGFSPTDEEKEIQEKYKLTNEQLNWRRYKLAELGGNTESFQEQFPSNPTEAFIVSGNPIWSTTLLQWYLRHAQKPLLVGNLIGAYQIFFDENPKGFLKVWKKPDRRHNYVIGADVAEGLEILPDEEKEKRADYSCAVVMDVNTAEIVAVWHGRLAGDQYGRQLDLLGRWYNEAIVGVERNNQGLVPLVTLRDLNYPRIYYQEKEGLASVQPTNYLGWRTDRATRPLMVDEAGKWLREKRINIYDEDVIDEMMSFVRYPDGHGAAASGAFDDRVMALCICIQMAVRNNISSRENEIEQSDQQMGIGRDQGDLLQGEIDFMV